MKFKYFTHKEFDCNSGEGRGVDNMNESFICMLDDARERAGIPFNITSGYRTPEYNKALMEQGYKTSKDSSHTKGIAADISTPNSTSRYKILDALLKTGFNRIGIGNTFIHCDTDTNKIQNVTWTYY